MFISLYVSNNHHLIFFYLIPWFIKIKIEFHYNVVFVLNSWSLIPKLLISLDFSCSLSSIFSTDSIANSSARDSGVSSDGKLSDQSASNLKFSHSFLKSSTSSDFGSVGLYMLDFSITISVICWSLGFFCNVFDNFFRNFTLTTNIVYCFLSFTQNCNH